VPRPGATRDRDLLRECRFSVACDTVRPSFSRSPWILGTARRGLAAHPPNQISEIRPDHGPTASASTLPCPVAPEPLPVPADHGLWPHHPPRIPPALPEPREHEPEDAVHSRQPWPRLARLPHGKCCRSARFSSANSRCVRTVDRSVPRRIPSHLTMTGQIADQSAKRKTIATDDFSGRTGDLAAHCLRKATVGPL